MPELHIQLFGSFQMQYQGEAVTGIKTQRLQDLLIYLILNRNCPQTRSQLAYLFWPESTNTQARTNLRNAIFLLRKDLPFLDNYLFIDTYHIYWCEKMNAMIDVAEFERLIDRADKVEKEGDIERSKNFIEEAAAMYKGDLVPACYTDWIDAPRERLRHIYILSLECLISYKESRNDLNSAINLARTIINLDPLYENAYRTLMNLLALSGNRAEALRSFHRCSEILHRELQVEPSLTTFQLYESLLKRDTPQPSSQKPNLMTPLSTKLIGRQKEWNQLLSIWDKNSIGNAHFVLISGESGIGKTRFCEELLEWEGRSGIQTASMRCCAADSHLAYAPITAWLRSRPLPELDAIWLTEMARLLPELLVNHPNLQRPARIHDKWQRQFFYEALVRTLLNGRQPTMLFIDNLQWIDEDSLDWLYYLLRFNWNTPLIIISAIRTEDVLGLEQVAFFLNAIRNNDKLTEIELQALSEEQTVHLVKNLCGAELSPSTALKLYRETEGNPLFVIEMIRSGWDSQEAKDLSAHNSSPVDLPTAIQRIIKDRLANLSTSARDLLELAAIIGDNFSMPVLARASGMQEDVFMHALEELSQRHIVQETSAETYHFSHMKLREVVYATMSSVKKDTFRRRLAKAVDVSRL